MATKRVREAFFRNTRKELLGNSKMPTKRGFERVRAALIGIVMAIISVFSTIPVPNLLGHATTIVGGFLNSLSGLIETNNLGRINGRRLKRQNYGRRQTNGMTPCLLLFLTFWITLVSAQEVEPTFEISNGNLQIDVRPEAYYRGTDPFLIASLTKTFGGDDDSARSLMNFLIGGTKGKRVVCICGSEAIEFGMSFVSQSKDGDRKFETFKCDNDTGESELANQMRKLLKKTFLHVHKDCKPLINSTCERMNPRKVVVELRDKCGNTNCTAWNTMTPIQELDCSQANKEWSCFFSDFQQNEMWSFIQMVDPKFNNQVAHFQQFCHVDCATMSFPPPTHFGTNSEDTCGEKDIRTNSNIFKKIKKGVVEGHQTHGGLSTFLLALISYAFRTSWIGRISLGALLVLSCNAKDYNTRGEVLVLIGHSDSVMAVPKYHTCTYELGTQATAYLNLSEANFMHIASEFDSRYRSHSCEFDRLLGIEDALNINMSGAPAKFSPFFHDEAFGMLFDCARLGVWTLEHWYEIGLTPNPTAIAHPFFTMTLKMSETTDDNGMTFCPGVDRWQSDFAYAYAQNVHTINAAWTTTDLASLCTWFHDLEITGTMDTIKTVYPAIQQRGQLLMDIHKYDCPLHNSGTSLTNTFRTFFYMPTFLLCGLTSIDRNAGKFCTLSYIVLLLSEQTTQASAENTAMGGKALDEMAGGHPQDCGLGSFRDFSATCNTHTARDLFIPSSQLSLDGLSCGTSDVALREEQRDPGQLPEVHDLGHTDNLYLANNRGETWISFLEHTSEAGPSEQIPMPSSGSLANLDVALAAAIVLICIQLPHASGSSLGCQCALFAFALMTLAPAEGARYDVYKKPDGLGCSKGGDSAVATISDTNGYLILECLDEEIYFNISSTDDHDSDLESFKKEIGHPEKPGEWKRCAHNTIDCRVAADNHTFRYQVRRSVHIRKKPITKEIDALSHFIEGLKIMLESTKERTLVLILGCAGALAYLFGHNKIVYLIIGYIILRGSLVQGTCLEADSTQILQGVANTRIDFNLDSKTCQAITLAHDHTVTIRTGAEYDTSSLVKQTDIAYKFKALDIHRDAYCKNSDVPEHFSGCSTDGGRVTGVYKNADAETPIVSSTDCDNCHFGICSQITDDCKIWIGCRGFQRVAWRALRPIGSIQIFEMDDTNNVFEIIIGSSGSEVAVNMTNAVSVKSGALGAMSYSLQCDFNPKRDRNSYVVANLISGSNRGTYLIRRSFIDAWNLPRCDCCTCTGLEEVHRIVGLYCDSFKAIYHEYDHSEIHSILKQNGILVSTDNAKDPTKVFLGGTYSCHITVKGKVNVTTPTNQCTGPKTTLQDSDGTNIYVTASFEQQARCVATLSSNCAVVNPKRSIEGGDEIFHLICPSGKGSYSIGASNETFTVDQESVTLTTKTTTGEWATAFTETTGGLFGKLNFSLGALSFIPFFDLAIALAFGLIAIVVVWNKNLIVILVAVAAVLGGLWIEGVAGEQACGMVYGEYTGRLTYGCGDMTWSWKLFTLDFSGWNHVAYREDKCPAGDVIIPYKNFDEFFDKKRPYEVEMVDVVGDRCKVSVAKGPKNFGSVIQPNKITHTLVVTTHYQPYPHLGQTYNTWNFTCPHLTDAIIDYDPHGWNVYEWVTADRDEWVAYSLMYECIVGRYKSTITWSIDNMRILRDESHTIFVRKEHEWRNSDGTIISQGELPFLG